MRLKPFREHEDMRALKPYRSAETTGKYGQSGTPLARSALAVRMDRARIRWRCDAAMRRVRALSWMSDRAPKRAR